MSAAAHDVVEWGMAPTKEGIVGKQEKAAKKVAKATVEAEVIVAAAKTKAADDTALAQQVKALRDTGTAWWRIGFELGLPGSADNVRQGKGGASKARSLYKKAFGALPDTPRSMASKRGDRVYGDGPKPAGTRKKDVIRKDPTLASMFTEDHSDEDIAHMLRGKRITFVNSMSEEQDTVRIHGHSPVTILETPSGRAVQFRESHESDSRCDPKFRYLPAHMRTIVLTRIIRVAS